MCFCAFLPLFLPNSNGQRCRSLSDGRNPIDAPHSIKYIIYLKSTCYQFFIYLFFRSCVRRIVNYHVVLNQIRKLIKVILIIIFLMDVQEEIKMYDLLAIQIHISSPLSSDSWMININTGENKVIKAHAFQITLWTLGMKIHSFIHYSIASHINRSSQIFVYVYIVKYSRGGHRCKATSLDAKLNPIRIETTWLESELESCEKLKRDRERMDNCLVWMSLSDDSGSTDPSGFTPCWGPGPDRNRCLYR